uniref:CUB domain-containing protein n=1 Tax=Macrostomum lignano TaxID=282301 RepID=A0A1I8IZE1_9PLAT
YISRHQTIYLTSNLTTANASSDYRVTRRLARSPLSLLYVSRRRSSIPIPAHAVTLNSWQRSPPPLRLPPVYKNRRACSREKFFNKLERRFYRQQLLRLLKKMKLLGLLIATISRCLSSGVLSSNYGYPRSCSRNYVNRLDCTYELISGRNNYGNGVNISFAYFSVETRVTGYFTGSVGGFSRQLPAMRGTPVTLRWVTDARSPASASCCDSTAETGRRSARFRLGGTVNIVGNEARGSFRIDPFKKK